MKRITLTGPFTDAEQTELLAWLRRCDERNPTARFTVVIEASDGTTAEAEAIIRAGLPEADDRRTLIFTHRKQ